jgi:hypothetical protein
MMAQQGPNTTHWYTLMDGVSGKWVKVNRDSTLSFDPEDQSHKFSFVFSSYVSDDNKPGYLIFSHTTRRFLEVKGVAGKVTATGVGGSQSCSFVVHDGRYTDTNKIGGLKSSSQWCNMNNFVVECFPGPMDDVDEFVLTPFTP